MAYDPDDWKPQPNPTIHFAVREDAEERVHNGPAICRAGYAHRHENDQLVTGIYNDATCKNCIRIVKAINHRRGED